MNEKNESHHRINRINQSFQEPNFILAARTTAPTSDEPCVSDVPFTRTRPVQARPPNNVAKFESLLVPAKISNDLIPN
jgi:hypothetical protein